MKKKMPSTRELPQIKEPPLEVDIAEQAKAVVQMLNQMYRPGYERNLLIQSVKKLLEN